MEHKGTKVIQTDRLTLRPFQPEDAEAAFRNWTSDAKVTEFLRWPTHESMAVTEYVIREWVAGYEKLDFYQWAIVLKEIDEPVGSISVVGMNENVNMLHVGYCIGRKWWRQGITSEAFSALLPYFFEEVGANRVEAQHDPNNPHSGSVMKKCGLKYEGTLRSSDRNNQGICDASYYSLLKPERFTVWESRR